MIRRFNTVGYLFGHWGIGFALGGMASNRYDIIGLGVLLAAFGNLIVALTKEEKK